MRLISPLQFYGYICISLALQEETISMVLFTSAMTPIWTNQLSSLYMSLEAYIYNQSIPEYLNALKVVGIGTQHRVNHILFNLALCSFGSPSWETLHSFLSRLLFRSFRSDPAVIEFQSVFSRIGLHFGFLYSSSLAGVLCGSYDILYRSGNLLKLTNIDKYYDILVNLKELTLNSYRNCIIHNMCILYSNFFPNLHVLINL